MFYGRDSHQDEGLGYSHDFDWRKADTNTRILLPPRPRGPSHQGDQGDHLFEAGLSTRGPRTCHPPRVLTTPTWKRSVGYSAPRRHAPCYRIRCENPSERSSIRYASRKNTRTLKSPVHHHTSHISGGMEYLIRAQLFPLSTSYTIIDY